MATGTFFFFNFRKKEFPKNFSNFFTKKNRIFFFCGRPIGHDLGHPLHRKQTFFFKGGLTTVLNHFYCLYFLMLPQCFLLLIPGAAHGLCAILQMLLGEIDLLRADPAAEAEVRQSVDYMMSLMQPSGNIAPDLGEALSGVRRDDKSELVHWCHGGPGELFNFIRKLGETMRNFRVSIGRYPKKLGNGHLVHHRDLFSCNPKEISLRTG